jgi:hypothetical protein
MTRILIFAALLCCLGMPVSAGEPTVADLAGVWTGQVVDPLGNGHDLTLTIEVAGGAIHGTLLGAPPSGQEQQIVDPKLEGDQFIFYVEGQGPRGRMMKFAYKGTVAGKCINGVHEAPIGRLPFALTRS